MKIITHACIHLDEAVAIKLLKDYGEETFPGVKKAKIEVYNPNETYTDQDIQIGIGGGIFDEHSTPNSNGNPGECAATLVAKHLGIDDERELQQILKYTKLTDAKAASSPFEIASIFNLVSRRYPNKPEKAYKIAAEFIDAKYEEQIEFFAAIEEFTEKVWIENIETSTGLIIKLASIGSDNAQILKAARYENKNAEKNTDKEYKETDILMIFRSNGHVQIFNTQYKEMDMMSIVVELRKAELKKKNLFAENTDLGKMGVIPGAEEWCYANPGQILNGSFSHPYVAPTKLTAKEVCLAVIRGIMDSRY